MKYKNIIITVLSLILSINCVCSVMAVEENDLSINSAVSVVDSEVFDEIIEKILYKYGDVYSLNNFDCEIQQIRNVNDYLYVDVNIIADMTLTRHPSQSEYVIALKHEATKIENEIVRSKVDLDIEKFVQEIEELYFEKTERSTFKYTIKIPNNLTSISLNQAAWELFYRVDVTDDEVINTPVINYRKLNANIQKITDSAKATVDTLIRNYSRNETLVVESLNTIQYNRLDARDYALDHATDEPEFSKANGQGSDCANFVSKALNDGGFPVDDDNGWYPSTNGTTATCGINWMRTGYYNNGGVVPYMEDQGYFYEQTNERYVNAGSIMYWNNKSHVALVTYGDTETIKYTQHSNVKLSASSSKNIVYETEDASFYMPDTSNVTVEE